MKEISYIELLEENQRLGKQQKGARYNLAVLSNVTVNLCKEVFEYYLRCENINAHVKIGDYDNIVQDTLKNQDANVVIIFWEIGNAIDGLQFKANLFDDKEIDAIFEKLKSEIDLVVQNLAGNSLVLINKFSTYAFSGFNLKKDKFEKLADDLNEYLQAKATVNIKLVDIEKIFAQIGLKQSMDYRGFYSSRSLYSVEFFKAYAQYVNPVILSVNGNSKKALILDCDNTLWKGVLGEDGFDNIEMSAQTKDGAVYAEIQSLILSLCKEGVIIGLCSKNNEQDIQEVISTHPDMLLKDEHISVKKINWLDKPQNLREIAQELNIGLESIVIIDDSSFEVNFIKNELPGITALQVPERVHDYPLFFRKTMQLFYKPSITPEDLKKTQMYKQQVIRENSKKQFSNIEEYLKSLALKVMVLEGNDKLVPRLSQLSQKTNQFNLTTKRYTEEDIKKIVKDDLKKIMAFSVSDKFGDSGITGMAVINLERQLSRAHIESYMLSCRVIGRNIEFALMDYIVGSLKEKGFKKVTASYIPTAKNGITQNFYDQCGYKQTGLSNNVHDYALEIDQYQPKNFDYLEVINGNKNKENYVHCI